MRNTCSMVGRERNLKKFVPKTILLLYVLRHDFIRSVSDPKTAFRKWDGSTFKIKPIKLNRAKNVKKGFPKEEGSK